MLGSMADQFRPLLAIIIGSALTTTYFLHRRKRYPPGPVPLPFVGNVFQVDPEQPWISYSQFGQQSNTPLVYTTVLGQQVISINDREVAKEVLSGRGNRHAGRPRLTVLVDIIGAGWAYAFQSPSHPLWRPARKESESILRLSESGSKSFHELEIAKVRDVVAKLKTSPENWRNHCRFFAIAFGLDLAYGVVVHDSDDPLVDIVENCVQTLANASLYPLVELFPWIRYLPSWLPGMRWKRETANWFSFQEQMVNQPFELAKQALKQDPEDTVGVVKRLLKKQEHDGKLTDDLVKAIPAVLISGVSDTVTCSVLSFLLLMVEYPDIQATARQHIQSIVGKDQLPTFRDRESLPYIMALIYEVLRVASITPMGVPHCSMEDDIWEYNGQQYFIPKDTIMISNIWAMNHDPTVFDDPWTFNPNRYLKSDGTLNAEDYHLHLAFGFSPRKCPGIAVAEDLLFIFASTILSQFLLRRKGEKEPKEPLTGMPLDQLWKPGYVRSPKDLQCEFMPLEI